MPSAHNTNKSNLSQDDDLAGGANISSSTPSAADPVELDSGAEADASGDGGDSNSEPDDETSSEESNSESGSEALMDENRNAAEREYLR